MLPCKEANFAYKPHMRSQKNTEVSALFVSLPYSQCGKIDHSCHTPKHLT